MKTVKTAGLLILISLTWVFSTCKKTELVLAEPIGHNASPIARAGNDTIIYFPSFSTVLDGSQSSDPDNSRLSFSWRKILGPFRSSFSIKNPTSVQPYVNGIDNGVFVFELTVTNSKGLFSKDTVQVSHTDTTKHETTIEDNNTIIFKKNKWYCPVGCWLTIYNVMGYLPVNSQVKSVFIKRDFSSNWELVPIHFQAPSGVYYEIIDDGRFILTNDRDEIGDSPDVKIQF
jgi:hypothetical protein